MRSSFFTLSILSVLTSVLADSTPGFDVLSSPEAQKTYYIGGSLPIVWAPGSSTGTITLTLIGGTASNNLNPLTVIASKIDSQSGSYTWSPIPAASVIGSWATYGVNLTSDADPSGTFQYSYAFHIAANETSSSTSSSSSATTTASTSTTASSTLTSTSSAESSTITTTANTTVAVVTSTASANTTLATLTATTSVTGASNSTATGSATGTSKPAQPTTAGAGRLVAGGAAVLGSVVFALFL